MDEHTIHLRPPVWLPILVALIVGGMYIGGKLIESRDATPTVITVSGDGKVSAVPDIASLTFGVQTGLQTSAKAAIAKLTKDMNAILASVQKMGIEDKDIRTQQLSLNPLFDWTEGRQVLRGYEATQSLLVKVRDLDKVGDLLSAATQAGANQIGGVQFTIDHPEALQIQARLEAIEEAQAKALKLAGDLGMRLGKLKAFNEGGGYSPPIYMRSLGSVAAMEQQSLPVPEGEQEVTVSVSLSYELK